MKMPIEVICSVCGGTGKHEVYVWTPEGNVWEVAECPVCKGKGKVIEETWQEKRER